MNKNILTIVIAVVAVIVVGGSVYYWKTKTQKLPETPKPEAQQAAEDLQKTTASVSTDIGNSVSPDVTTPSVNPINTDPNPYNKTNPFSDLKVNPFQ